MVDGHIARHVQRHGAIHRNGSDVGQIARCNSQVEVACNVKTCIRGVGPDLQRSVGAKCYVVRIQCVHRDGGSRHGGQVCDDIAHASRKTVHNIGFYDDAVALCADTTGTEQSDGAVGFDVRNLDTADGTRVAVQYLTACGHGDRPRSRDCTAAGEVKCRVGRENTTQGHIARSGVQRGRPRGLDDRFREHGYVRRSCLNRNCVTSLRGQISPISDQHAICSARDRYCILGTYGAGNRHLFGVQRDIAGASLGRRHIHIQPHNIDDAICKADVNIGAEIARKSIDAIAYTGRAAVQYERRRHLGPIQRYVATRVFQPVRKFELRNGSYSRSCRCGRIVAANGAKALGIDVGGQLLVDRTLWAQ